MNVLADQIRYLEPVPNHALLDTMPPVYFQTNPSTLALGCGETFPNFLDEDRQDVLEEIRTLFWPLPQRVPQRKLSNPYHCL